MILFFKGIIIGFCIAAPVGPIGLMCIRRSIALGRLSGLITGLGAATADTIYGMVAAFGLSSVTDFLLTHQRVLSFIGGVFLCILAKRTYDAKVQVAEGDVLKGHSIYFSTLILTLTSPATVLLFIAAFASIGIGPTTYSTAWFLVAGVFTGSMVWWLILSGMASFFGRNLEENGLRWLNRISGLIAAICGGLAITSSIFP